MAPRLPVLPYRKVRALLLSHGFRQVGQQGSHVFFRHPDGRTTTVPRHGERAVGRGLLAKILKDAEIDPDDLR